MTRHHIVTKINTPKKIHKEKKRLLKKMNSEKACPPGYYVDHDGMVSKINKFDSKLYKL